MDHFTSPEGEPGKPETNFNNRPNSFMTGAPPRTAQVRTGSNFGAHTAPSRLLVAKVSNEFFPVYLSYGTGASVYTRYR